MTNLPQRIVAVITAMAIVGAVAFFLTARPGGDTAPAHATVLPERLPLPEFSLEDHNGAPFTRDDLRGRTSLLFFGFTHCPDICPATLQQLSAARRQIVAGQAGDADVAPPQIVLISVDPERDTPEALRRYVEHFGEGITGVTGEPEELDALTSTLGIFHEKVPTDDGDYTISHSTAVLVIDPGASLQALFSSPHEPEHFARDVPVLMAAR